MWYTVYDNISGEVLEFSKELESATEVIHRVDNYRNSGDDPVVVKNENNTILIICRRSELK